MSKFTAPLFAGQRTARPRAATQRNEPFTTATHGNASLCGSAQRPAPQCNATQRNNFFLRPAAHRRSRRCIALRRRVPPRAAGRDSARQLRTSQRNATNDFRARHRISPHRLAPPCCAFLCSAPLYSATQRLYFSTSARHDAAPRYAVPHEAAHCNDATPLRNATPLTHPRST